MADIIFPTIGNTIVLESDFVFPLYHESRNLALFKLIGITDSPSYKYDSHYSNDYRSRKTTTRIVWPSQWDGERVYESEYIYDASIIATLPKGTVLTVDRIYIRKGLPSYDSITFWAKLPDAKKKVRFWAKIIDINGKMKGEWVSGV